MELEMTARHTRISKALRTQAEEGMDRIARIIGRNTRANVIFRAERHLYIAELTIKVRLQTIVATGKADRIETALRIALSHAEHQALRHRDRHITLKRLPKEEKVLSAPPVARPKARAAEPSETNGSARHWGEEARAAIAVHSFPARSAVVEPHILTNGEALALRPMTIEEAVKDAEFRDRDLLVFRNSVGALYVLHRRRDGQMEIMEIP